jgi:hypothetical protein
MLLMSQVLRLVCALELQQEERSLWSAITSRRTVQRRPSVSVIITSANISFYGPLNLDHGPAVPHSHLRFTKKPIWLGSCDAVRQIRTVTRSAVAPNSLQGWIKKHYVRLVPSGIRP